MSQFIKEHEQILCTLFNGDLQRCRYRTRELLKSKYAQETLASVEDLKVGFGKYAEITYAELAEIDIKYLIWMARAAYSSSGSGFFAPSAFLINWAAPAIRSYFKAQPLRSWPWFD